MESYDLLLIAHIVAAILFIGPATVASSRFPQAALAARDDPSVRSVALEYHRTSATYSTCAVAVPVLGLALAQQSDRLEQTWVIVSIVILALAAVDMFAVVLPLQRRLVARLNEDQRSDGRNLRAIRVATGCLPIMWTVVLAMMVVKPW